MASHVRTLPKDDHVQHAGSTMGDKGEHSLPRRQLIGLGTAAVVSPASPAHAQVPPS
jgi:hypothetical protein